MELVPIAVFADSVVTVQYIEPVESESDVGVSESEDIQAEISPIFPDPINNEEELIEDNAQDELSQVKAENDKLKQEIDVLKKQIQDLQQIIMEQVKVMIISLGISS